MLTLNIPNNIIIDDEEKTSKCAIKITSMDVLRIESVMHCSRAALMIGSKNIFPVSMLYVLGPVIETHIFIPQGS